MSAGERKKRAERGEGWEEAGAEFYQESYPGGEVDLDHVLQKDPHHLATLLPSKQTRTIATRKKETKATLRRRTSTRSYYGTARLNTTGANNDVQVSIMPDLSENLSNEERTWEEIMKIKTFPVCMSEKKEMKARLLRAETFRLQGFEQFKWQKKKICLRFKTRWKEVVNFFGIWDSNLQKLEKECGAGIASFFTFTKTLIIINLALSILIFLLIIYPIFFSTLNRRIFDKDIFLDNYTGSIAYCSFNYQNTTNSAKIDFDTNTIFSLIEGTEWMESTPFFYGVYPATDVTLIGYFRMSFPLVYISVMLFYYFGFFFKLLKKSVRSFEQQLLENQGQFYLYCNLIFSGWDFSIGFKDSALARHKSIYIKIREFLRVQRQSDEKFNQTADKNFKLLIIRLTVNLIIFTILMCAVGVIYYVLQYCATASYVNKNPYEILIIEYFPAASVILLNYIVPEIYSYFITFQNYNPASTKRITLIHTILLRLALLGVLIISVYNLADCKPSENECINLNCKTPTCWETYFGQQLYKILILNLVLDLFVTFFINFPRKILANHFSHRFVQYIGKQSFNIPKHILDIAYIQTICWLAAYYAPLFPLLATFLLFITFYIKKFSCTVNCSPSAALYPASELESLFVYVLSICFIFSVVPWTYTIFEIMPSKSCGPFRGQGSVWWLVMQTFHGFPSWIKMITHFCSSSWFVMPIIVALISLLYYYYSVSIANQQMVIVLKKQLILEGHDKQFLLNRLSAFIKQQQEKHKAMARSVDVPRIK